MKYIIYVMMVFLIISIASACQINFYPEERFENMLSPREQARNVAGCCEPNYDSKVPDYPWLSTKNTAEIDSPWFNSSREQARNVAGCCEPNYDSKVPDYPWLSTKNTAEIDSPWFNSPREQARNVAGCCEPNYDSKVPNYPWLSTNVVIKCLCTY